MNKFPIRKKDMELLLALTEKNRKPQAAIADEIDISKSDAYNRFSHLEDLGWIYMADHSRGKIYRRTDEGDEAAKHLKALDLL